MIEIKLPANDYVPRHYQQGFWDYMQSTPFGARAILCHHRRAGKDHTVVNWISVAAHQRIGLYIHVFPYGNQGRRVIWNGVDGQGRPFLSAFPKELIERQSDLEMRINFRNGSVYQVIGADDPDKLVGINCVGAAFSEFSLMDPQAFRLVQPILNENKGWAVFPSTPRGKNHFYDLVEQGKKNPKWYVSVAGVNDTGAVDPALIEEDRKMGMDEALIQQEYYVSFTAALQGSYYEKQMNGLLESGRITDLPFDPALEVHTAWDLGMNDSTAIWFFQQDRVGPRVIWYYEASGESLGHYVRVLRDMATKYDWTYATHYGPHDLTVRELSTGHTRIETAQSLGLRFTVVPKGDLLDGIEAVRQLLPRCWFDAQHCHRGLECLRGYRREYDERLKTYRSKPLHDHTSHAADAMRTLAMGIRTFRKVTMTEKDRTAVSDWNPFS